jgi:uncharacterized protein (DUF433 family)
MDKGAVIVDIPTDASPLRKDASGAIRLGNTRVLLELVIHAFREGATPEAIVQRYSTTSLADVYAVITYYLHHREEVEQYLAEREHVSQEVRLRIEASQGNLSAIRHRLLAQGTG